MEPEDALPCSQVYAICPYLELDESNPQHHSLIRYDIEGSYKYTE